MGLVAPLLKQGQPGFSFILSSALTNGVTVTTEGLELNHIKNIHTTIYTWTNPNTASNNLAQNYTYIYNIDDINISDQKSKKRFFPAKLEENLTCTSMESKMYCGTFLQTVWELRVTRVEWERWWGTKQRENSIFFDFQKMISLCYCCCKQQSVSWFCCTLMK